MILRDYFSQGGIFSEKRHFLLSFENCYLPRDFKTKENSAGNGNPVEIRLKVVDNWSLRAAIFTLNLRCNFEISN